MGYIDSDHLAPMSMVDDYSGYLQVDTWNCCPFVSTILSHSKCHTQPETASLTARDNFSFLSIHLQFFFRDGVGCFFSAATAAIPDVLLVVVEEVIEVDGFEAWVGCDGRCWSF